MILLCSAYGSEVGSVAIKLIPTGGLYVTGGLTPKNIKWIQGKDSHFLQGYHDKGRVTSLLDDVPLFAVMVEDLGVRGARKNAEIVGSLKETSYFDQDRCFYFSILVRSCFVSCFRFLQYRNTINGRTEKSPSWPAKMALCQSQQPLHCHPPTPWRSVCERSKPRSQHPNDYRNSVSVWLWASPRG